MLALWMLSAVLLGSAVLASAALLEPRLRTGRRALWAAAILSALLLPVVALLLPPLPSGRGVAVAIGPIRPIMDVQGTPLGAAVLDSAGRPELGTLLAVGWGVGSLLLLCVLASGILWTRRNRRTWRPRTVDGMQVLVSRAVGPAVVGLRRARIVVPEWVPELPEADRRLILAHEAEHVRARDPALLVAGFVAAALVPWNPGLWWGLRRLRDAVETDCDARVLARGLGAPARYARLLLEAGARAAGVVPVGAGFGERPSSLERRIRAMLGLDRERGWVGIGARVALVALLTIAACSLEVNIDARSGGDETVPTYTAAEVPVAGDTDGEGAVRPEAPGVEETRVPSAPGDEVVIPPLPEEALARLREDPVVPPTGEAPGWVPPRLEGEGRPSVEDGPTFTPFTVAPSILNRLDVVAAMEREYPPLLRNAGVSGTVRVYFFIDQEGRVQDKRIDRSSGHEALDDAALRVAGVYRFSPAMNRNQEVPVWVSFPITFQSTR